jgi:hypothetical protein
MAEGVDPMKPGQGSGSLYDIYFVVEDDVVIDVWPIEARYGRNTVGAGLN